MSTATATATTVGPMIASSLALSLRYAEDLVKTIPADRFCEMPTKDMNHPAFCVGHLAIYANRVLEMCGRADLKLAMPFGDEHFKNGAPCVAQDGRYPSKDVLYGAFVAGWGRVLEALPTVDDAVFTRENPAEGRFKELFPTVGGAVNFLCGGHNMMHLGQVSTWRRAAGLGSAH
ncbi:MAG: DinB family protein [Phycisphaerales bacterium]